MLRNVKHFQVSQMARLQDISRDIDGMENYSDDEFDIFQNNAVANAYSAAKKKVKQISLKDEKLMRQLTSRSQSPERYQDNLALKINIIEACSPTGQAGSQSINTYSPQYLSPTYQTPIFTKQHTQSSHQPTVQFMEPIEEEVSEGKRRFLEKAQAKEDYARNIVDVYSKNENIDYDKTLKKLRKKSRMLINPDTEASEMEERKSTEV